MKLQKARIRPRGDASRLLLASLLPHLALETTDDVILQLRSGAGGADFCAPILAASFRGNARKRVFKRTGAIDSAPGIDRLGIVIRRDGTLRIVASDKRAAFRTPSQGDIRVTVGLRDPRTSEAGNRCASTAARLRTRRNGELKFP
jgi:hypothetical protein